MKAVRLEAPGRPLRMRDVPVPNPGPHDVLIRVKAAGICHSDAHYRAGVSPVHPLPMTLGHEVSGVVEKAGESVFHFQAGDRVCLHYLDTCGACPWCAAGHEQFCGSGKMMGKHRDGGFAEFVCMPARSVFALPPEISFEHGAVMMCSSATAFHALRKARLAPGETAAVFGVGGLGASAIQLAFGLGASAVYAVDISKEKLELARSLGAAPVSAEGGADAVAEIRRLTDGRGVDVALELIGLAKTIRQSVQVLAPMGRAAVAGLMKGTVELAPYTEIVGTEAELIGVSDHLASEIRELLALAAGGRLNLGPIVTRRVPLEADAINGVLDELDRFSGAARTVVMP